MQTNIQKVGFNAFTIWPYNVHASLLGGLHHWKYRHDCPAAWHALPDRAVPRHPMGQSCMENIIGSRQWELWGQDLYFFLVLKNGTCLPKTLHKFYIFTKSIWKCLFPKPHQNRHYWNPILPQKEWPTSRNQIVRNASKPVRQKGSLLYFDRNVN